MSQATDTTHIKRVTTEAHDNGGRLHGPGSATTRFLPKIVEQDEHVMAIIHGLYSLTGEKVPFTTMSNGMLLATNERVLFLSHAGIGYTVADTIDYDMISGVNVTAAGLFASITLLTRGGTYELEYTQIEDVRRFSNYVNTHHIDIVNDKRNKM